MTISKSFKIASLSAGVILVSASAFAQSASFGSNVEFNIGKDVKGAHASQGEVGVDKNGNLNVGGGVADGIRVGDSKAQASLHGKVSVPAAAVAAALAD